MSEERRERQYKLDACVLRRRDHRVRRAKIMPDDTDVLGIEQLHHHDQMPTGPDRIGLVWL